MCFVSSDCDFTPMVTRALAEGKVVLGFGERKAPSPFVNACSKFLFLDQEPRQNGTVQTKSKNIKSDTKLINLLRQAIESTEEDSGWAALGPVGSHISNKTSFEGQDEYDPVSGRGWVIIEDDTLKGKIFFHAGDESGFKAKRTK